MFWWNRGNVNRALAAFLTLFGAVSSATAQSTTGNSGFYEWSSESSTLNTWANPNPTTGMKESFQDLLIP